MSPPEVALRLALEGLQIEVSEQLEREAIRLGRRPSWPRGARLFTEVGKAAVAATESCATGHHLTLAVGYGGRQEVLDAVRDLLLDKAAAGIALT